MGIDWSSRIAQERSSTAGNQFKIPGKKYVSMTTSRKRADELWAMVRYHVLVSSVMDSDLKAKGFNKKRRSALLRELSEYIDQAENFYVSAEKSNYRSSALLYYYSFLNLAKVAIIVNQPSLAKKSFHHGIRRRKKTGPLIDRSAEVTSSSGNTISVFNELYKLQYGTGLVRRPISLKNILGYLVEISDEVNKLIGDNSKKVHDAKFFMITDSSTQRSWPVIAITSGFRPENFPMTYGKFDEEFERFTPSALSREFIYDMKFRYAKQFSFSQSKQEFTMLLDGRLPVSDGARLSKEVFGNYVQDNVFDDEVSFSITDPLRKNWQVPFNEPLSTYFLMYYLSEIVRYSPGEFNTTLGINSLDGWSVKSFIESTPYKCLNYLCCSITGTTYSISER